MAGDFHRFAAFALGSDRSVIRYFRDLSNRTIEFGPLLTLPTISTIATAPYARLRAAGTWQAEYSSSGTAFYEQDFRMWTVSFSRGYTGAGAAYQVDVPDLSGVPGFLSTWGLLTGAQTTWTLTFFDAMTSVMTEGGGYRTAARTGSITP
jgi:hypothetical protein